MKKVDHKASKNRKTKMSFSFFLTKTFFQAQDRTPVDLELDVRGAVGIDSEHTRAVCSESWCSVRKHILSPSWCFSWFVFVFIRVPLIFLSLELSEAIRFLGGIASPGQGLSFHPKNNEKSGPQGIEKSKKQKLVFRFSEKKLFSSPRSNTSRLGAWRQGSRGDRFRAHTCTVLGSLM